MKRPWQKFRYNRQCNENFVMVNSPEAQSDSQGLPKDRVRDRLSGQDKIKNKTDEKKIYSFG